MRIKKLLYLLFQIYHIIMVYENSKSKLDLSLIFLDFFFLNQLNNTAAVPTSNCILTIFSRSYFNFKKC